MAICASRLALEVCNLPSQQPCSLDSSRCDNGEQEWRDPDRPASLFKTWIRRRCFPIGRPCKMNPSGVQHAIVRESRVISYRSVQRFPRHYSGETIILRW
jgi:hypothetical protein